MYRIDNATAVAVMPAIGVAGVNPDGFFTDGDPGTSTPSTIVDAAWLNSFQEELCYVIEQAGLDLEKGDNTQLFSAIQLLAQQIFYASSSSSPNTYTATLSPAPAEYIEGMRVAIKFTNGNTGAATLNLNALGAINLKRADGTALQSGDILAGMIGVFNYDGTNFQMENQYLNMQQYLQTGSMTYAASTTAANTYTATLSPSIAAYTTGMRVFIKFTNANTGAATLNLNAIGAVSIKRQDGSALKAGDICAGMVAILVHDGTNFQLVSRTLTSQACRVTSSGQTLLAQTETFINLDTETFDDGNNYNTTDKKYVAPTTDRYSIKLNAGVNNPVVSNLVTELKIYVNGSVYSRTNSVSSGADTGAIGYLDDVIPLNAGDYVQFTIRQNDNVSLNLSSATFAAIHRLP